MSCEIVLRDIKKIMEEFFEKNGVKKYDLEIEEKSTKTGENYMGNIIFFKLSTEAKTYDMVMKRAEKSEELRKKVPIGNAYNREMFMYFDVFPAFGKFIEKVIPSFQFDFVPEVYCKRTERLKETIIFANLKSAGYKLCDRKKPWTLDHSLLAMKYYGKLHAISLAFSDQNPEMFRNLTRNLKNFSDEFCSPATAQRFYEGYMSKVLELLKEIRRYDLVKKFEGLGGEATGLMPSRTADEDKLVICHGDCWNNNIMFKYQDTLQTKPWKLCFLDFQLSALDTPVFDLSWNIYATCDKSCLDHIDLLLHTYYESLSENVKYFGSDPEKVFSYTDFRNHWRKYAKYGVLLSSFAIKITLAETEEAPNLAEAAEAGRSVDDIFTFDIKDVAEYKRRILDVFTHFGDKFM